MSRHKVAFASQEWERPAPGVRTKVHRGPGVQLRLVEFSAGFVEADWCVRGHVGYVLNGRMEVDFDGTLEVFEAGDGLFIPAGEAHKHKARILTDTVVLILVESVAEPGTGDGR